MSGTAMAARAAAHVSSPFDNGGSRGAAHGGAAHGGALHSPLRTKEISSPTTNMKASVALQRSSYGLHTTMYYVRVGDYCTRLGKCADCK